MINDDRLGVAYEVIADESYGGVTYDDDDDDKINPKFQGVVGRVQRGVSLIFNTYLHK